MLQIRAVNGAGAGPWTSSEPIGKHVANWFVGLPRECARTKEEVIDL